MKRPNDFPIPEQMKHLPLDHRGYPIFYIALRTPDGKAIFTANDVRRQYEVALHDLCEICGRILHYERWFIGGPLSAFHEQGSYIDAPMHEECAHYSLNVCPWLAAPNYGKSIAQLQVDRIPDAVSVDHTMSGQEDKRPALFVAVACKGQDLSISDAIYFRPHRPYAKIEYWQHGKQLSDAVGSRAALEYLQLSGFAA